MKTLTFILQFAFMLCINLKLYISSCHSLSSNSLLAAAENAGQNSQEQQQQQRDADAQNQPQDQVYLCVSHSASFCNRSATNEPNKKLCLVFTGP